MIPFLLQPLFIGKRFDKKLKLAFDPFEKPLLGRENRKLGHVMLKHDACNRNRVHPVRLDFLPVSSMCLTILR